MNIIEKLPVFIGFGKTLYQLKIYPNAWGNLTITYGEVSNMINHLFSACVEKNNPPRRIESTEECWMNSRIGNAPTFDEAAQLVLDYIELNKDNFTIEQ